VKINVISDELYEVQKKRFGSSETQMRSYPTPGGESKHLFTVWGTRHDHVRYKKMKPQVSQSMLIDRRTGCCILLTRKINLLKITDIIEGPAGTFRAQGKQLQDLRLGITDNFRIE
jgi:hypothetical protein